MKRASGTLTWEPGTNARIQLEARLIDERNTSLEIVSAGEVTVSYGGDPASIVEDGAPRIILGETQSGPVTCVDAYLQRVPPLSLKSYESILQQVWEPYTLIFGAHLPTGNAAEIAAVRCVLDSPAWWEHFPDVDSAKCGAGEVRCERTDTDTTWIAFHPSSLLSLRSADRVVHSIITLMKLAVDVDLTLLRMQVREPGKTNWLEVKSANQGASEISWPGPGNLIEPAAVSLQHIARWLEMEQQMDGLAAAVANPVKKVAIQVQTLVACSLVEGIHKRIVGGKKDYIDRVRELHQIARRVDPEVTDSVQDWDVLIKNARNDLAHHNEVRSPDEQFYNWMIAESSTIWVLRLCLLAHANFTDEQIVEALREHQRYAFYRENLKMLFLERAGLGLGSSDAPQSGEG